MFVWDRSVFNQYSYHRVLFCLGPELRLCDRHRHGWVCYINTTKIAVWCMSSILIHMTYFFVYTIFISEHHREIFSYSPAPSQQVCAILWKFTITVWLQSQVHCVTFKIKCIEFYITKYRNTLHSHYFFVPGAHFWTTGNFKVLADCQCILHLTIILSSKYHNISKGKGDILKILILLFHF